MAKQTYRIRNWKDYNKALVTRGSLTFWFSEEVVENWTYKADSSKKGRPYEYSELAIVTCLTLRQLFRLPLRNTQGLISSILQLLGEDLKVPNYTTLSRRAKTLEVDLQPAEKNEARHVLVDSTGVQVIGEGEWKVLKHGATRCQVWKKLHILMDAQDQNILSAQMTDSVRLDGNYLPELLDKVNGEIGSVTGDGAYDKQGCYQAIYEREAQAIIPPQHNAAVQRNKYKTKAWLFTRDNLINHLGRGIEREEKLKLWKRETGYHRRSLVETMMFRMKTLFGDEMRSRAFENQRTDLLIRCYAINRINTLGLPKSELIA